MTLQDFDQMLAKHDWYYAFSDDHSVFLAGEARVKQLYETAHADQSGQFMALIDLYSRFYFTGEPWGTPQFTRDELDAGRQQLGVI